MESCHRYQLPTALLVATSGYSDPLKGLKSSISIWCYDISLSMAFYDSDSDSWNKSI